MEEKLSYIDFSAKMKSKYPEYKDIDDMELAQKIVNKYPEYKDVVSFDVKKKDELGAEVSSSVEEPTISDGNNGLVSTPTNEILAEQPKKSKGKEVMLSGVKDSEEKEILSNAIDQTEGWYKSMGGITPFEKIEQVGERMKELDKQINSEAIANMGEKDVKQLESDYQEKAKQIVSELGLNIDDEGNITVPENERQQFEDKLALYISTESKSRQKEAGFFDNFINKLAAGQETFSANTLDMLGTLTGLNNIKSFKRLSEGSRLRADQLSSQANRYDQSIEEYVKSGDVGAAAGLAVSSAFESLPSMIPVFANPTYGLYAMSAMSGIDKYRELETAQIPEWKKVYNSFITGASEYAGEKLVTIPILSRSKQALLSLGETRGKAAIEQAVKKTVESNASKLGSMPQWVAEGMSEVATGISTDLVDKVTVNPDTKIGAHAGDDFVVGAVMGKIFSLPQDVAQVMNRQSAKKFAKEVVDKLPADMDVEAKINVAWKIAERDALVNAENKLDDKFKGKYQERIVNLNTEIEKAVGKYSETEKPTIGTVEPVSNMQKELDYLKEQEVDVPDGTTAEQLKVLYDETKAKLSATPVAKKEAKPTETKVEEVVSPKEETIATEEVVGETTQLKEDVVTKRAPMPEFMNNEYYSESDRKQFKEEQESGRFDYQEDENGDVIVHRGMKDGAVGMDLHGGVGSTWTIFKEHAKDYGDVTSMVLPKEAKTLELVNQITSEINDDALIELAKISKVPIENLRGLPAYDAWQVADENYEEGQLARKIKKAGYDAISTQGIEGNEIYILNKKALKPIASVKDNKQIKKAENGINEATEAVQERTGLLGEKPEVETEQTGSEKGKGDKADAEAEVDEFETRRAALDTKTRLTDIKQLAVGDYVAVKSKSGAPYVGFVTKKGTKNIIVQTKSDMYGIQELQFPVSAAKSFYKPISTPVKPLSPQSGVEVPKDKKAGEKAVKESVKPKNISDVEKAGVEIFGLNKEQSKAQAIIVDKIIEKIAKRRGVTKEKVYGEIEFKKGETKEGTKAPQGAKGAIQFLEDGRAIISAMTDPNVSTPLHEIAHLYEKYMTTSERNAVLSWAKHKEWTTATSEKFARGFEKYLADGKAPNEELKRVFERFKKWLTEIYNGITGSEIDLQLNDAMRGVYASMLGEDVVSKTTAKEVVYKKAFDEVDNLLFQGETGVLYQDEDKTERHTLAINKLVDNFEKEGETNVAKAVRDYLSERGNPVSEEIVNNVLKERGYAKEDGKGSEIPSEEEGAKGKEGGRVRVRDDEKNRVEAQTGEGEVKPSRFGLRYFTELSKVPKATQEAIAKSGITNYKTTSLQEADDISTEIVANNTTEDLTKTIVDDVDMNNALWVAIATKTQQKLDREIYAAKKKGEDTTAMVNNQLSIVKRVTADVSAAGLLLRAVQAGFVTDYLAPITWVKAYTDAVKNKKAESEKSKWLKRSLANFESKIKKATEKSVEQTLEKAKKETERAEKKLTTQSETSKKRDDIMARWKKSIQSRGKILYQSAKNEFEWTEEDINFAKEIVQTYIEDGIYSRTVIEDKLRKNFEKLKISISDEVLGKIIPTEFNGKSLDDLFEEQQLDNAAAALASRIFGEVIDKNAKAEDPMKIMVNTLLGKFREREKAPSKEKKSDLDRITAAIRGVKEYEQVWKEAKDLAIDKINELDISEFEKELATEKIENAYDKATNFTFTENQVKSVVRKYIRDNQIKMSDIVRSHLSIRNATRESIKKGIIAMSGLNETEADILAKSISDIWERTLKDNSKSIVDRETKRMKDKIAGITRTAIHKTDTERLLDMIVLGAFEDTEFRDAYSAIKGIPQLDATKAAKIESLAEAVRVTPSTTVKRMRKQDLLMYMKQIEGVELGELADTIWYGFILGNVPTQIRNTIGAFGNTYGVLLAEALTNPLKIPQILRSQKRGGQMGVKKAGVILRTGKQFFENVTDMPAFSEYAKESGEKSIFKYIAYLMRWMSANDQTSMSIGKESFASLLAEEHLKVNRFKKLYDPKYRKTINEAVDKLLSITPEQVAEIDRLVNEEAIEFDYDENEKIVRKQELIDEARPKDLLMEAEKAASRATGNTKAYGTLAQIVDKITWLPRNFEIQIPYKGKKYSFRPFKMLATFTRISTAIANLQLGFTPIGYFNVLWNKHGFFKDSNFNAEMTPVERKQMLQRATFGTLTIALLYALVNPDDDDHWLTITANGTGNYKDNEELRNSGKWRPYSIYLGGMDGIRVSYRYSPFALMLATVGYMSDRKKYVKKHKDTPDINLLLQAMLWYPPFMSETTPLGTSIKFLGDVFGGVGYGESKIDPEKMVKTLANTAKGYYAPSIVRDVIDFADYIQKDYKAENSELYNSMIDRTPADFTPLGKEDKFPARDAWGLPVERINSLDEFAGIGSGDVYSDIIRYHWDNAGVLGKPQRDGLFELWYNDGSMQAGQLTRKHVETRELWNEVYLKNRGEYLREAVLQLKSEGIKGEEYVKEFNKLKAEANERAKKDVMEFSLMKPLDKKYKEDK